MEHLVINSYGYSLSLKSNRLIVKKNSSIVKEVCLNTLKTIQVNSDGVTLSSNLLFALSANGIEIFFYKNRNYSTFHTMYEHKTANIRIQQYKFCNDDNASLLLAKNIIANKIENQRATLIYEARNIKDNFKNKVINLIDNLLIDLNKQENKQSLLGIEGISASLYFSSLSNLKLFPQSFRYRTKRNSTEITNIALNYGYAILCNRIYSYIVKSGLDPYCSILHTMRSGKPSLILDIMEQYRSYIVDRAIIKLKNKLENITCFDEVKSEVANKVLSNFSKSVYYNENHVTVDNLIIKQINQLKGHICANKPYSPYIFRW